MNWWSSKNWCEAQGKHLMDISEFDCYRKSDNTLVQTGQTAAYCCKQGQACQQSSWSKTLWNGKSVLPGKLAEVEKFSDKMIALRKVYGEIAPWSSSPYAANSSLNSCYVFFPYPATGYANTNYRYAGYVPLCE